MSSMSQNQAMAIYADKYGTSLRSRNYGFNRSNNSSGIDRQQIYKTKADTSKFGYKTDSKTDTAGFQNRQERKVAALSHSQSEEPDSDLPDNAGNQPVTQDQYNQLMNLFSQNQIGPSIAQAAEIKHALLEDVAHPAWSSSFQLDEDGVSKSTG
ncbi:hypothetical protein AgCh_020588 [Apium graveolens]